MIRQIKQQFESLVSALKACLRALGLLEVKRRFDSQSHMVGYQREQTDFLFQIGIRAGRTNLDYTESPMHSGEWKRTSRRNTELI